MKFISKLFPREQKRNWLFKDPKDIAVFTTRHVVIEGKSILYVYHDEDDGAWQFHSGDTSTTEDMMVVGLGEIVDIDPAVMKLANLPLGWVAYRENTKSPWQTKVNH